jgi:hypothetical protein
MIEFICSSCGKHWQADGIAACQTVQCPGCHANLPSVKRETAIVAAEHASRAAGDTAIAEGTPPLPETPRPEEALPWHRDVWGFLATWFPYAAVTGVILLLVALLIPAVQKIRDAAARTQSTNNLKTIGLAMASFHDVNKRLPFNGSDQAVAKVKYSKVARPSDPTSGSWLFQILPYCDQKTLYAAATSTNEGVPTFMCPGRGRYLHIEAGAPWNDYHINILLNSTEQNERLVGGFDAADVKRSMVGVTDGVSNTIFAGHGYIGRDHYWDRKDMGNWSGSIYVGGTEATGRALGVRFTTTKAVGPAARLILDDVERSTNVGMQTSPQPWGGPFPQGALFVMGDATVRMFPWTISQVEGFGIVNFGSFLTPVGGEHQTLNQ